MALVVFFKNPWFPLEYQFQWIKDGCRINSLRGHHLLKFILILSWKTAINLVELNDCLLSPFPKSLNNTNLKLGIISCFLTPFTEDGFAQQCFLWKGIYSVPLQTRDPFLRLFSRASFFLGIQSTSVATITMFNK